MPRTTIDKLKRHRLQAASDEERVELDETHEAAGPTQANHTIV